MIMATNISWDVSDFLKGTDRVIAQAEQLAKKGAAQIADEILRLSQFEVPHDTGLLQNSGHTEPDGDGQIVGYNKVYAARLHEHPEYRFGKGRKGKYLEDPIKNNMLTFQRFMQELVGGTF